MPKKDRTRCEVLKSPPRKRAKQDQSNSQIALSSPSQSRDDSILKHADEYTSCFCFVNKRKLGNHKLYYQRSPSWLSWPLFSQLSKFSSRDHVMKKLYNSVMKVAERPYEYGMHGAIFNLEFSPDNQYLLAACEKNDILVYDPWNFNKVHVIPNAHREGVNCINFLDTRMFATCSDDKRIAIWDIRNLNSKVFDLIGHTSWVKSMCKSSGNLISSAFDDTVRFWDLKKNSLDSIKGEIILEMPNLTRTKLSNKEGEKSSRLYVATTTGLLLAVHNLDITTLKNDTDKELKHIDKTCVPDLPAEPLRKSYTPTKSNQVELIQSFPAGSKPWCIASIQLHPTEDMVLSRYTNQRVNSEWSVVHSLNTDPSADCYDTADMASFRLRGFIEEPNSAKGYIKELCYSKEGWIICSPFGNGVRLLALNNQEDCTTPKHLTELKMIIGHECPVLTTRFSPYYPLLASGCLNGKVVFHQPVL